MAQSVKCPTLDFSSDSDLVVCEFKPRIRLQPDNMGPVWDFLSPSLSSPPLFALSLKTNKHLEKRKKEKKN